MILVTGGAGFIGSHLVDALLRKGEEVICVDSFDNFYDPEVKRKNIAGALKNKKFVLKEGDIREDGFLKKIFDKFSVDKVVHLAARAGVRTSFEDPMLYADVNINGTIKLLELSRKKKIKKFILGSSSSVYGVNPKVPFSEEDPLENAISPYAVSKIGAEKYSKLSHDTYGLPVVVLRFFTVYGPRQRPEMAIHKFTRLMDRGEEIPVFGNGKMERDYTYIMDIIKGIMGTIEKDFDFEVFNLGDSRTIKLLYLLSLIESELGKKARLKILGDQPGDVPVTYADITKAKEKLSYNPAIQIEEGVKRFVEWYKKNF